MKRIPKFRIWFFCVVVLLAVGAWAQDSSDSAQPSLGDMVKQQKEQRQHSKPAKRVVSDDDIPANRLNWMNGFVAEFVIIPAIRIEGLTPIDPSSSATSFGQKKDKIYVGFGPNLLDNGWCNGPPECSEKAFLRRYQRGAWVPGSAKVLFDSDESVGDYDTRVAHFQVLHQGEGKMLGSVAIIETPIETLNAFCIYREKDRTEAEPECDEFISSLRVTIPEHYVYVHQ